MRASTATVRAMIAILIFAPSLADAQGDPRRQAFPTRGLRRQEPPSRDGLGGAIGLVVGGLMGLSIAGLTENENGPDGIGSSEDVAIIAGATGLFTLMGVGYGAAMAPHRWQDATLHPPANRGMGETGSMRVGIRIAF